MDNTVSLCGMPTELLVRILCFLPDLQTIASSNLTCRRIHDVCAENTKAITDALIASIECSELAIRYYEDRLQFTAWRAKSSLISPSPRLPRPHSCIQRAWKILAIAEIGHRAHNMYLTRMTQPITIDREFWQSIFYKAMIVSSTVLQQTTEIGLTEIQVQLFGDLDILTLSQISDMYRALLCLSIGLIGVPRDATWREYSDLPLYHWHWQQARYLIFCIRSYLCEHSWYRDWTCGIGEGSFMASRKPYGKMVKDLIDEGHCAMGIRRVAYKHLLMDPLYRGSE